MSKIERFIIGKGVTRKVKGSENDSNRKYLQLEIRLPEQYTEQGFHEAVARAELLINGWLQTEVVQATGIPEFNPDDLMKHPWKGRKTGEGEYMEGSTSWGWDFKDKFSEDTIKTLEKGPVTIDKYVFTLNRGLVNAKKKSKE